MKKIYTVSKGVYSSYDIVAVFSSKKRRDEYFNEYAKIHNPYSYGGPFKEEFELDPEMKAVEFVTVSMKRDGTIDGSVWRRFDESVREYSPCCFVGREDAIMCTFVEVTDEQAVKSTNEMRAIILANNAWGNDDAIRSMFSGEK